MDKSDVLLCACIFCSGLLAFTFDSFYGCSTSSGDTWLMFAVDIYRMVSTLILMIAVYLHVNMVADLKKSFSTVFGIFALGSIVCFLIHIIKLSETRTSDHCLMKNTDAESWNLELLKIFSNGNQCEVDTGVLNYIETMENPHLMSSAKSWCSERIKQRCKNRSFKYTDITNCIRHGATDLIPHLRYIYVFDLLGDMCRFFLCVYFALKKKRDKERTEPSSVFKSRPLPAQKFRL